jgi:hypothetical protein
MCAIVSCRPMESTHNSIRLDRYSSERIWRLPFCCHRHLHPVGQNVEFCRLNLFPHKEGTAVGIQEAPNKNGHNDIGGKSAIRN